MFCLGQRYCPRPGGGQYAFAGYAIAPRRGGNTLRRYGYVLASLRAYAYAARLFRPAGSIRRAFWLR